MFNQGHGTNRSGVYNSYSPAEPRTNRGIFTNAGLSISNQDDSIQHNFRYQVDREKLRREAEAAEINKLRRFQSEANFQTISNVNPNAYKSYATNLDKIGNNVGHVDTYANEVQSAKERLFQDQQNMLNLQKLNRLNADQHRQHMQKQLQRIRDPVRDNDIPPFRAVQSNPGSGNSIDSRTHLTDTDQDLKLSLLDKFSLNNGLEDQLSAFAQGSGGLTGRSNANDYSRDYGDMSRYMGAPVGTRAPTSSFRPHATREPVQPYSPYMTPGYTHHPPPPQYYPTPAPAYGYNIPAPSNENNEMKSYMQKQTDLLERISDKLVKRKEDSRERTRRNTREFENRFKDFEKETELRLQLMKQQQTIENLQTQHSQPRQKQQEPESRNSRYRPHEEPKNQSQALAHFHSQSQPDIFTPQNLAQNFMQHLQPFQFGSNQLLNPYGVPPYDAYLNAYGYPGYGAPYDMFSPYPYSASFVKDKKKKKKKAKKRTKSSAKSDSSDDSDSNKSDSDGSDDESRSTKRGKSSRRNDKKDRKDKDKDKKNKGDKKSKGKNGDPEDDPAVLEERKKKAKANLRIICWTIAYQKIFETDISQKVINRRTAHQQAVNNGFDAIAQNFATWLMNVAQEGFTKLFDDVKKNYDFVGLDFKKPSKSDITKRSTEAKNQTKFLLTTLLNKTDANEIDDANLEFLAGVSYRNVYLSDNTFSVFELMRIKSNMWGRITEMTKEHSQMILCSLLIVRLLTFQLIFKANEWNKKTKWTPQALANFKIVGSLVYRIANSIWEELLPVVNEKPSQLECVPLTALTLDPILAPIDETPDNPEMIFGALSSAQLAPVLEEDKAWTESIKQILLEWTGKMYDKLAAHRQKNPVRDLGPLEDDVDTKKSG